MSATLAAAVINAQASPASVYSQDSYFPQGAQTERSFSVKRASTYRKPVPSEDFMETLSRYPRLPSREEEPQGRTVLGSSIMEIPEPIHARVRAWALGVWRAVFCQGPTA